MTLNVKKIKTNKKNIIDSAMRKVSRHAIGNDVGAKKTLNNIMKKTLHKLESPDNMPLTKKDFLEIVSQIYNDEFTKAKGTRHDDKFGKLSTTQMEILKPSGEHALRSALILQAGVFDDVQFSLNDQHKRVLEQVVKIWSEPLKTETREKLQKQDSKLVDDAHDYAGLLEEFLEKFDEDLYKCFLSGTGLALIERIYNENASVSVLKLSKNNRVNDLIKERAISISNSKNFSNYLGDRCRKGKNFIYVSMFLSVIKEVFKSILEVKKPNVSAALSSSRRSFANLFDVHKKGVNEATGDNVESRLSFGG